MKRNIQLFISKLNALPDGMISGGLAPLKEVSVRTLPTMKAVQIRRLATRVIIQIFRSWYNFHQYSLLIA